MIRALQLIVAALWLLVVACGFADAQLARMTETRCYNGVCRVDTEHPWAAFCIGYDAEGRSVLVSAGHGTDPSKQFFAHGQSAKLLSATHTPDIDVAVFVTRAKFKCFPLTDGVPQTPVKALGYPDGLPEGSYEEQSGRLIGTNVALCRVRPGYSGGPLLDSSNAVIGVVDAYVKNEPEKCVFTPTKDIITYVKQCCPTWQPCLPRRPPGPPASAPPAITTPDVPDREKTARLAYLEAKVKELERRYQLARGPQGERGPAGADGPSGPQGIPGLNGKNGLDGKDGKDAPPFDYKQLEAIKALADRPISVKVYAVAPDGSKRLVDEKSFARDKPIILNMAEKFLVGD